MISTQRAAVGLVIALATGTAVYAQSNPGRSLMPQDYAEIQQLYATYAWAIDTRADNGMAYARTFTADGEFYNAATNERFVGHAEIAAMITSTNNGQPSPVPTHFTTNIVIEPSREGARGAAYLLVMASGQGAAPTIPATSTYRDVLVKTSDGWRFKQRMYYRNAMPPVDSHR